MSTDTATDLFLSLTPDKVLGAVEAGGLRCNPVCYTLNSFENRVYEIELEDQTRIVAKFYRPKRWTKEQIEEEHQFLADLEEAEIPVCGVLPFPDGTTVKQVDHIYYSLFPRRGGRAPDELSDDQVERLGMFAARIHNVGAQRPAQHRIRLCADTYVRQNLAWLDANNVLPSALHDRYVSAANGIADIADEWMDGVAVQRVLGDLHLGNLLLRNDIFFALDFDDMVIGPPVQDLWLLLPGTDQHTRRQHEIFVEAYEQFRAFDRTTLRLIGPLRGLRYIHYATWIARRWHDPAFPQTWPHFGTEDYWRTETADLEDLLRTIRQSDPSQTTEPEPEEELTNKDFFWDMDD